MFNNAFLFLFSRPKAKMTVIPWSNCSFK